MDVSLSLPAASMKQVEAAVASAVDSRFASRLAAADDALWGVRAQPEAHIRLGWTRDPRRLLPLCEEIVNLRDSMRERGVSRAIVCGMGGSSLGPDILARREGAPLTVVDSTHPDLLAPLAGQSLSDAVVVISSKSGTTIETDSHLRIVSHALEEQGLALADHLVIVTDPNSQLHEYAQEHHLRVFLGEPEIGGRYSVLSPFGLVPAGLAGVETTRVIDEASHAWPHVYADSPDNPALLLGAAIALGDSPARTLLLNDNGYSPGFASWVEQLVAESSGKDGRGILPVVESARNLFPEAVSVGTERSSHVTVQGTLGELVALWQVATVYACALLGVNPFDQPNVESAKVATRAVLTTGTAEDSSGQQIAGGRYWASTPWTGSAASAQDLVRSLVAQVGESDYVALMVYGTERDIWAKLRNSLEQAVMRPVTLGMGPRFLHSTGQFHKGGPAQGVFLSIIETPQHSVPIPGRDFDCSALVRAQAFGDRDVLIAAGRPVLVLELDASALAQLTEGLSSD